MSDGLSTSDLGLTPKDIGIKQSQLATEKELVATHSEQISKERSLEYGTPYLEETIAADRESISALLNQPLHEWLKYENSQALELTVRALAKKLKTKGTNANNEVAINAGIIGEARLDRLKQLRSDLINGAQEGSPILSLTALFERPGSEWNDPQVRPHLERVYEQRMQQLKIEAEKNGPWIKIFSKDFDRRSRSQDANNIHTVAPEVALEDVRAKLKDADKIENNGTEPVKIYTRDEIVEAIDKYEDKLPSQIKDALTAYAVAMNIGDIQFLQSGEFASGFSGMHQGKQIVLKLPALDAWEKDKIDKSNEALQKEANMLTAVNNILKATPDYDGAKAPEQISYRVVNLPDGNKVPVLMQSFAEGLRLHNAPPREMEDRIRIFEKIGKLAQTLYAKDLAHMDIKPDAIFWDDKGDVTLIDWNSAVSNPTQRQKELEFTAFKDLFGDLFWGSRLLMPYSLEKFDSRTEVDNKYRDPQVLALTRRLLLEKEDEGAISDMNSFLEAVKGLKT